MKKSTALLLAITTGLTLTGFSRPRSYSDLAEYSRTPIETRVDRMQKAGEDLFLRRRYEDAITVFETVESLDKGNMKSRLWVTKARTELLKESQDQIKQQLIKKHGHLIPKEKIYDNWHWGPSVGHFEVRYSEPKPYVRPVRKVRPEASQEDIIAAEKKAGSSGAAEDYFELAMLHWSRRAIDKALQNYFKAMALDTEMLARDDELMLATIAQQVSKKIETGQVSATDLLDSGKLEMIQGDRVRAVNHLVKAVQADKGKLEEVSKILSDFVESPQIDLVATPPDIFSVRQAYVFDQEKDTLYLRILLMPKKRGQIVPFDLTIPEKSAGKIEISGKDTVMVLPKTGINDALRLWFVLPEKQEEFPEYELKVAISIDRKTSKYLELSNFSLAQEQPDNWSFVIGSEFNFDEAVPKAEYEKKLSGLQISGYHLSLSDGSGPVISLEGFKEPLPRKVDIWKLIETGGEEAIF